MLAYDDGTVCIICCGKAVRLNLDEPFQNVVLVEAPYSSVNSLCVISSANFEDM